MIITRTPYRVSFFGGGTDYPAWFRTHGGKVLAAAINKYCYITCRYLPPFFEHRYRVVYSRVETCQKVEEIQHPVVRTLLHYQGIDQGVEIHHDGDLPARSGVGSSCSFTVGLLHALHALKGRVISKDQLSKESIYVEQELLKETVGCQDQVMAAYGGFNCIIFSPDGQFTVHPVTLPAEQIQELSSHLMLCYTGVKRTASDVAQSYVVDLASRERQLHSLAEMVDEGMDILRKGRDLIHFGRLLDEAWRVKRSLSAEVSNPVVDEIMEQAKAAGAVGGKLLGAGGGGFVLFLATPADQARVRERLRKLIHVPFKFDFTGSQIIFFNQEQDSSPEVWARARQAIRGADA